MFDRKIKSTPLFSPYTGKKCTLERTGKGVYYILKNGKIIYIGKSLSDVKSTMYRHFQKWTDERKDAAKRFQLYERVTYHGADLKPFKCKILFIQDNDLIDTLEQALIKKHHPKDNTQKLAFYTAGQEIAALDKIKLANIETVPVIAGDDWF